MEQEEEIVRAEEIEAEGGTVPINLWKRQEEDGSEVWGVDVDGGEWFEIDNEMHAIVLFQLMAKHITDYVHYVVY